jgi:hypothetical protein
MGGTAAPQVDIPTAGGYNFRYYKVKATTKESTLRPSHQRESPGTASERAGAGCKGSCGEISRNAAFGARINSAGGTRYSPYKEIAARTCVAGAA